MGKSKHYAIAALPAGSRLCKDETMVVMAFGRRMERDAWVAESMETRQPVLRTHGEQRRAATRGEAAEAAAEVECAIHGGKPSRRLGYAALAVMGIS